jgi:hypothetical protein
MPVFIITIRVNSGPLGSCGHVAYGSEVVTFFLHLKYVL